MVEYTRGFVKSDGINTHYYRTGSGASTIILLHGASDNGACWGPTAELLAEQYDVVMPDALGHGRSDRLGADFTQAKFNRQVVGLVKELKIEKPVIIGHSMGAGTAVSLAAEYPDLPGGIVLEDPAWRATETNDEEARKQRDAFVNVFIEYSKLTREELIAEGRKSNPGWSEEEFAPWAESKLQFDTSLFSYMRGGPSFTDLIPKITCPGFLITSEGGIVPDEMAGHATSMWEAEQPLEWIKIDGAGHNIRREQFGVFTKELLRFLKKCAWLFPPVILGAI